MDTTTKYQDEFDWRGCDVVQFDPEKLGGRATVRNSRMDADGILSNYQSGLSVDEIVDEFGVDREAVEKILDYASSRHMKASA